MRMNVQNKPKIVFLSLLIVLMIRLSTISSAFDPTYSLSLRSGFQVFEVKKYDEDLWNTTVNPLSNPSNLFGGEANISGAKSKLISLYTCGNDVNTYGIFRQFFFRWFSVPYNSLLKPNGYDYEYIIGRYPYYNLIWDSEFGYWNFTTNSFKDYADHTNMNPGPPHKRFFILRDPSNFSRILLQYNDFATVVNNDPTIQAANYSIPLLNGEEFLWQLIIDGLIIADPSNSYLNQIIDVLDCSNASVQDNSLTLRRTGEKIFIVEIKFNNLGMMDTILMKNTQNEVFYHITSSYPQNDVYIFFGVICGAILGLVGLNIYIKSRQKKEIARCIR